MPTVIDSRRKTEAAVQRFGKQPLRQAALGFLDDLGYRSQLELKISGVDAFRSELDQDGRLNPEQALLKEWKNVEFLRQVTGRDLSPTGELFRHDYDPSEIQSYVFLAIDLKNERYTRNKLSQISRAVNRIFMMPALLIFKHGESLTFSVVNRRLNKRDQSRDVLEKVTLIKDISTEEPLRAHTEILTDLSLEPLRQESGFRDFEGLHNAWSRKLSSYALNERFYREISDWYFWSRHLVEEGAIKLPLHCDTEQEKSLFLIRLLTRLIFCWFLVEKKLLPASLFRPHKLESFLKNLSADSSTYYHAILQNLFFGTLNMPPAQRGFREKRKEGERYNKNYGITNLWRYERDFRDPAKWVEICRSIPFLNGGLFDCLDDKSGKKKDNFILDGFSDREDFGCHLPNELFFGGERAVDLSKDYGEENKRTARSKRAKVSGLIEILSRYKFTIEENTPLEEEIALDPELLGKVFENLLASYNEDTKTTARKALGAFYTPREIVSYMVDESLKSYLATQVPRCKGALEDLFSNKATLKEIKPDTREALIAAIGRVKILDPACGSGAFPMGALHRLVDLLQKLDPNNESWKRDRLAEARRYREILAEAGASKEEVDSCDARIADIEKSFDSRFHALDYARKLFLIENCIYGVDIQPIATQIAKLRFFISLVVDQKVDAKADNFGVRPLPNLETRIVAADSLIPIEKAESDLLTGELDKLRAELSAIRHEHFSARSPAAKRKWREADEAKRGEIAVLLERNHALPKDSANKLAAWNPYDQNCFAPFFDSEWMFGLPIGKVRIDGKAPSTLLGNLSLINESSGQAELIADTPREIDSGFDIVIGNPPYIRIQTLRQSNPHAAVFFRDQYASAAQGNYDIYVVFIEAGLHLLKSDGHLAYICPHKFFNADYGEPLRAFIASGGHLRHVVHFGDEQVFPGATIYCCLLFLSHQSNQECRFVKADDLAAWRLRREGQEAFIPATDISGHEWSFTAGDGADVFRSLQSLPIKLGDVSQKIYQGLATSADAVYVLRVISSIGEKWKVWSASLDCEVEIERGLLRPILKGAEITRFAQPEHELVVLFPYNLENESVEPMDIRSVKRDFPNAYAYLHRNKATLLQRSKCNESNWWLYPYPKNLALYEKPKIVVQVLSSRGTCFVDRAGEYYFLGGGTAGGNAVRAFGDKETDLVFLAAILNSPITTYHVTNVGSAFRGGFFAFGKSSIFNLPLPCKPADIPSDGSIHMIFSVLRWLNTELGHPLSASERDSLMMAFWEQLLNALIYELYFPDEVHGAGLHILDLTQQAGLPEVDKIPEKNRLSTLRKKFEELHDGTHPVRQALDKLQTLEAVRIIEGKG